MAREMLYPIEDSQVSRHSSIDQYRDFLSVIYQGGYTPIVFDQLDGIDCNGAYSHPVVISFSDDIGYQYKDAECTYFSDNFVYFDKEGVEQKLLPECMGGKGEFYDVFVRSNIFVNFDDDTSIGTHNKIRLRVGTDYVLANKTLPAVD